MPQISPASGRRRRLRRRSRRRRARAPPRPSARGRRACGRSDISQRRSSARRLLLRRVVDERLRACRALIVSRPAPPASALGTGCCDRTSARACGCCAARARRSEPPMSGPCAGMRRRPAASPRSRASPARSPPGRRRSSRRRASSSAVNSSALQKPTAFTPSTGSTARSSSGTSSGTSQESSTSLREMRACSANWIRFSRRFCCLISPARGEQRFEVAVFVEELRRGLRADARHARHVVGGIADQRLQLDHLLRPDAELLLHLPRGR